MNPDQTPVSIVSLPDDSEMKACIQDVFLGTDRESAEQTINSITYFNCQVINDGNNGSDSGDSDTFWLP